jgi:NADP-dependent aldehyde dehydrogenase
MLIPIGPVVVFAASNFPLAFSVAGGDTASALAAGNSVVVKAHPAHPGTSELVADAIARAAQACDVPAGVFSLIHGVAHEVGLTLVRHPVAKAVGFTGSLAAGRALFDAASARPEPIPVHAEMGSVNPVFVLPGALQERADKIADGLAGSVCLGAGQFCTNPGLVLGVADDRLKYFTDSVAQKISQAPPATMLYRGILHRYEQSTQALEAKKGIVLAARSSAPPDRSKTQAAAAVFKVDGSQFILDDRLYEEIFGPATLLVACKDSDELLAAATRLPGELTATIHGTEADLARFEKLVRILETKAGRLIFNGFPTGVEVCPSMQHGGPYPATTDVRFTSVGAQAIKRFARPVCFQNWPQAQLPPELQDSNPRKIWRLVDGTTTT